jgi:hypothetical protein
MMIERPGMSATGAVDLDPAVHRPRVHDDRSGAARASRSGVRP